MDAPSADSPETGEHVMSEQDRLRAVAQAIAGCKATLGQLTGERDQLVRVLHEQGLSLRDISESADVSHVTVGEIVNGRRYGAVQAAEDDTEREFGTPRVRVLYGMKFADIDGLEWVGVTDVAEYAGMQPGQAAEVLAELVAAGLVEQQGQSEAIYRLTS